jgi:hypothetical protein
VERFVECVLRAMNEHRIEHPFQPTWATAWSAFLPHEMAGPDRWAQALGLCKVDYPRWFVLLRYRVREAGTLVRPTQLDAGWGVYHFPSPPQARLETGGKCMDLNIAGAGNPLLPEFIHKQIEHTMEHWLGTGQRIGRTTRPINGNLAALRRAHYSKLCATYGPGVSAWMPECI